LRRVETGWIAQEMRPAKDLREAMAIFEKEQKSTYSVAWIDCLAKGEALGRSLVMLGDHAEVEAVPDDYLDRPLETPAKKKRNIPVDFPSFALNSISLRMFNQAYYKAGLKKQDVEIVDWDSFFYPLDAILGWNRIYGRRGFVQFQCVLPLETSEAGLSELLLATSSAKQGSFLAVLKRLGAETSPFSFPMEGYTLALDFPVSAKMHTLLDKLDQITLAHGGRFYLAKDSRMSADTLARSDKRLHAFQSERTKQDWRRFSSVQSERLGL